ncbi:MAG: single stranded DNA-binding domain-containing protein [Myxococcales bacterium]
MSRPSILFATIAAFAAFACSSSPSGSDGGTSTGGSHGTTGGGSGGSSGGSGGTTYCDGVQITNGSGTADDLLLYPIAGDVNPSACSALVKSEDDAGNPIFAFAGTLTQAGGIWDSDAFASGVNGLYPGGCDDVGVGLPPAGNTPFTPPASALTVQQAVAAATDGGASASYALYGIVTFVAPWAAGGSGSFYLQDPASGGSPAPYSGIDIYVPKGAGPATVPSRGEVVEVTDVSWSPYNGVNEFAFASDGGSSLNSLGQATLPPPVAATAAQLAPSSTALDQYKGMRVIDAESFTVGSSCPAALQYGG